MFKICFIAFISKIHLKKLILFVEMLKMSKF